MSCNFREKITPSPVVMFHHTALDPKIWRHKLLIPCCSFSVAYRSIRVSNTTQIFRMIWHICNSKHSISNFWYVEMISWILALSSMTPWPDLAADVTCVTSPNLLPSSHLRQTSSQYCEHPPPSTRNIIYGWHQWKLCISYYRLFEMYYRNLQYKKRSIKTNFGHG